MAWVKVDDKFPRGPKVKRAAMALGGKHPRTRILGVWLDVMAYCNLHETDGFIPDYEVSDLDDAHPEAVMLAMASGQNETPGPMLERDEARKGWVVRNYGQYQPTRAELEAKRDKERVRKMSARTNRGHRADNDTRPTGQQHVSEHPDPARSDPARSEPDAQKRAPAAEPPPLTRRDVPHTTGGAMNASALTDGRWNRTHGQHQHIGACTVGACILPALDQEFAAALSVSDGRGPDGRTLREFYDAEVAAIEAGGWPVSNTWSHWRAAFERWIGPVSKSAARSSGPRVELGAWRDECQREHGGRCTNQHFHVATMNHARMHATEPEQVSA